MRAAADKLPPQQTARQSCSPAASRSTKVTEPRAEVRSVPGGQLANRPSGGDVFRAATPVLAELPLRRRSLTLFLLALVLVACGPKGSATEAESLDPGPAILLVTLEELSTAQIGVELGLDLAPDENWHQYRAVASSGSMVASLASILTGLRPWQHGLLGEQGRVHRGCERLGSSLRAAGYKTFAWTDRARRLGDLGFRRGFDEFGALRSGRQAVSVLESMDRGQFVWIHLRRPSGPQGTDRQLRRLQGLLTAARAAPGWEAMTVAIAGVTGTGSANQSTQTAAGFSRSVLEVPVAIRSPETADWFWSDSPLIAATQLYQTLADPLGVETLPALGPSLVSKASKPDALALVSETYGRANGERTANDFSLVRDGVQLRWTSRGPLGVADVPPLTGYEPVELSLWTWGEEQPRRLNDPAVEQELAQQLHQAWLADQDREEGMSWRTLGDGQP